MNKDDLDWTGILGDHILDPFLLIASSTDHRFGNPVEDSEVEVTGDEEFDSIIMTSLVEKFK